MIWFNQLKVRSRFLIIALFILPFLLGLGGAGVWGVLQINGIVQTAQDQQIPSLYSLSQLAANIQEGRLANRQALLETEPTKVQQAVQKAQEKSKAARQYWEEYQKLPTNAPAERSLWPEFETAWQGWQVEIAEISKLALINTPEATQQGLVVLARGNGSKLSEATSKLIVLNYQDTVKLAQSSQQTFEIVMAVIVVSALGVVIVIGLAGLVLARSILRLTDNLSSTNYSLSAAFSNIEYKRQFGEQTSLRLKSMTTELNATAAQQASGSQQQAGAIEEVTSSIAELAQTAANIATNAGEIDRLTEEVRVSTQTVASTTQAVNQVGKEGGAALEKTIESNHKVQRFYQELVSLLVELEKQSSQVKQISELIRSLGEETHLLALNAAIEAAGAGEQGARFAVVASEVKQLADKSVAASKEVTTTLGRLKEQIGEAALSAEQGQHQTVEAVSVAEKAGMVIARLIEAITTSAQEVAHIENVILTMNQLSHIITLATSQQSSASSQVLESLQEIGVVARQSASGSSQVSATVSELEDLSYELNQALAA